MSAGVGNWVGTCTCIWKSWSQDGCEGGGSGSSDGDTDQDGIVVHVCNVVGNGTGRKDARVMSRSCSSFKLFHCYFSIADRHWVHRTRILNGIALQIWQAVVLERSACSF